MSVFEMIMLICFGSAWPFSIYNSYASKQNEGKSVVFLFVVLGGYISGIIHKLRHSPDPVTYLYVANAVMVAVDIALYYRNVSFNKKWKPAE